MGCAGEVLAQLASSPGLWAASCARLGTRCVCHQRDVRRDEAAPCSVTKTGADDDVDVVDGLGREFATGTATGGKEVVIEAIDVFDAEPAQVNVADTRVDVVVDHPLIAVCGRGAQLRPSTWHPLLGEEPADRQRPCRRVSRRGRSRLYCRSDRFGVDA